MTFNRNQAGATHLLGSALVALCSAALVFLLWYPTPLAGASGVTGIFLILLAVDVGIGPLITLIVFDTAKKELKRDLLIVLLLQVAALLYGLHAVFAARPVYAVFNVDRFDLVYANDLDDDKLRLAGRPQFRSVPVFGPEVIAARRPDDRKERNQLLLNSLTGGDDLPQLPKYYVPYADEQPNAVRRVQLLTTLRSLNEEQAGRIDELVRRYAGRTAGIGFLPLKAKRKDLAVIVTLDKADVLEIADLKPWP